ncbi:MAG: prepilin-type N-terminal cleavage/methylation domain-containing protein, partial [Phycisphaerales bacterium JB039]
MRTRCCGFTLIELIVVVAIVGLLIGILAPALAGAMTTARRAKCMSNLKGFGPALQMYVDSANQGILPAAPGYSAPHHNYIGYTRIYVLLNDYMDAPLPPRADDGGFRDGQAPFLCPNDPGSPKRPPGSGFSITRPLAREHGFSYSYLAGLHMAPGPDPDAVDPRKARPFT